MRLPEPGLRMLPFRMATCRNPLFVELPVATDWKTLLLPPCECQEHRVSRLGSSSACSSSRSCIVTAGRVDMDPPFGVICLGQADRVARASAGTRASGTARRPYGAGPEPDVRFVPYILFGYHRTVPF